jgi:phosphoribosylaminoimidazole-succinocarboxamide synthase
MFDSARSILNEYIDTEKVSRFTFYSVDMERGENPEDIYYLCSIKDHYYVVFETDYIMNTLADIAREAADIFKKYDLIPLQWVVKKDSQSVIGSSVVPFDAYNVNELRKSLVTDRAGSAYGYAVRYIVIEFSDTEKHNQHRFHPTAYGGVS